MLGRLAVGCFNGLSRRFRCSRSIGGIRPVHLAPEEHPVSPPAANPRWVMLSSYLSVRDGVAGDATRTVAKSTTSTGRSFRVSADLAPPPATSFLRCDWEEGSDPGELRRDREEGSDSDELFAAEEGSDPGEILAAHGDSVLFEIVHWMAATTRDYFVYRAGAAARPPSLSLLPTHDFSGRLAAGIRPRHPREQILLDHTTGLLRRSEDELLVVELALGDESRGTPRRAANLNVLRLGSPEWEKRSAVPIVLADGGRGGMPWDFFPDRVVPVGDRFLCWVKYSGGGGILLCDMAADPNLVLRHLPLPVTPWPRAGRHMNRSYSHDKDEDSRMQCCRNMCGAGAAAVRFVSVDPRCCCGGPGRGTCPHSTFAFTVTTWTMNVTTTEEEERMAWAVDGVLDCEELWAMPGYGDLPRVPPECPVVSPDNPDIVCFKVSNACLIGSSYDQEKVWMLEVDTRRKVLVSVVQCPQDPYNHLPAKF